VSAGARRRAQFVFLAFLMGHSLEGFGQWKALLALALGCEAAPLGGRAGLFGRLLRALRAQLALCLAPDGARGGAPGPLGLPVAEELLTDSFLRRLFGRFFEAAAEAGARAAPIQARARRARPRPRPEMALPGAAPGTCPVFRAARGAWRAPALSQAHRAAEPPRLRGGRMRRPRECARPRAAPRPGGPRTHALPALRRRRRAVLGAAERRRLPSGRERLRPSPPLRLPEGTGRGRVHARESPALPSP
jgi:hypothetical protein